MRAIQAHLRLEHGVAAIAGAEHRGGSHGGVRRGRRVLRRGGGGAEGGDQRERDRVLLQRPVEHGLALILKIEYRGDDAAARMNVDSAVGAADSATWRGWQRENNSLCSRECCTET